VKELRTKISPFPSESCNNKKARNLTILCPAAAARCLLNSGSADRLMTAQSLEITQSNSNLSLSTL